MAESKLAKTSEKFNMEGDPLDRLAVLQDRLFMLSCLDLENDSELFRSGFSRTMMDLSAEVGWIFGKIAESIENSDIAQEFNMLRRTSTN